MTNGKYDDGDVVKAAIRQIQESSDMLYEVSDSNEEGQYKMVEVDTSFGSITTPKSFGEDNNILFASKLNALVKQLSKIYGVDIEVLTTFELNQEFKKVLGEQSNSKAFIYNGKIYLNIDFAHYGDLIHEFAHIYLGMLKMNPEKAKRYYEFVNSVYQLEDYDTLIQTYRDNGDTRAVTDLNEEIFVTKLGEMIAIDDKFEGDVLQAIQKTFGLTHIDNTVDNINNLSIREMIQQFGSELLSLTSPISKDFQNQAMTSRKVSNLLSQKIKDGEIMEECV